jgi:hypothetical protein
MFLMVESEVLRSKGILLRGIIEPGTVGTGSQIQYCRTHVAGVSGDTGMSQGRGLSLSI